jgi:hypothetical protein
MNRIVFILVMMFPGYCFSQIHLSLSTGQAGFNMKEMKKHQTELKAQFPVDAKVVESFPAFWFYELSLKWEITERLKVGGALSFTSTGGRIDYRDYSGEMECNQLTRAWVVAGQGEVLLNPTSKWPVSFTCDAGAVFGRYELDMSIDINNSKDSDNLALNSVNLFVAPGFMASRRIVGPLSATLKAGYHVDVVKGKQKLSDNDELYLLDESGNKIRLDWSGFRAGIGLSIAF